MWWTFPFKHLFCFSALIPLEGTYKCQGSIQLYTQGQYDGELGVSTFARKKYRNLKRKVLKRKNVYHFEIGGDCCWELYDGTRFSGNSLTLGNGGHQESLQPGSMKKRFCIFWTFWLCVLYLILALNYAFMCMRNRMIILHKLLHAFLF